MGNCYLDSEVSFGTTGVDTWCYLECYLVLPEVLPGVTWSVTSCNLGVAWRPLDPMDPNIVAYRFVNVPYM